MKPWIFRENSLDFIRLLAASQVALLHTFEFLYVHKTGTLFFELLRLFPGVPIFFFISGLLISKSFEMTPAIGLYAKNRALRIFPALIIVVAVNIIMVWSTGYFSTVQPSVSEVALLFLAKSTFLQFYNPDFMRGFGDGVLNGSLWTICVELQFYILTPILYILFGKNRQISNKTLTILILFFLVLNRLLYGSADEYSHEILWKLYRVSFAPWFYMFLMGIFVQRNFIYISKYISRIPFVPLLMLYTLLMYTASHFGVHFGNSISPVIFFLLVLVIFRAAYFVPSFFGTVLRGNDISYGIYIWHIPIVNQFLYYNLQEKYEHSAIAVIIISVTLAIISWFFIEKPLLARKKYSLKRTNKDVR